MVTLLWAAKGGSGTTVVATLLTRDANRPWLLIDLAGEVPAVLGLDETQAAGLVDWLVGHGDTSQLIDLVVDADDTTAVLPWTAPSSPGDDPCRLLLSEPCIEDHRWTALVTWAHDWAVRHDGQVVIDGGTGSPPASLAAAVDHSLLVTRACYLALRRARRGSVRPTGVVLVEEPGRSLGRADVEQSVGAPVLSTVPLDPAVARSTDCGLLASSVPRAVRTPIRRLAAKLTRRTVTTPPDTAEAA